MTTRPGFWAPEERMLREDALEPGICAAVGGRVTDPPAFGRFLEAALQHYDCEGVDISAYATRRARKRLPGVAIVQCALHATLPAPTDSAGGSGSDGLNRPGSSR